MLGILSILFDEYDDIRIINRKVNSEHFSTFVQFSIVSKSDTDQPKIFYRETVYWFELLCHHVPIRIGEIKARYDSRATDEVMSIVRRMGILMYIRQENISTMLRILKEAVDNLQILSNSDVPF